jgi:16S rRNA (guanine1516-N2)-methyltransferase
LNNKLAVTASSAEWLSAAHQLASELQLSCLDVQDAETLANCAFVLEMGEQLQLRATGRKAPGPVFVDFVGGAAAHRRKYGGGKGQQIARAVGIRSGFYPHLVDATAGLGRDAFVLASLGSSVHMLERNPVVRALLQDGLARLQRAAQTDRELSEIAARLTLENNAVSAREWLAQQPVESIPVVYLDPMFPSREKSAKVKKEMLAFHQIVGSDEDADLLLEPARAACFYRVVVKRPRLAPWLAGEKPALSLEGKSGRFDIYTKHGIQA